jgi:hypothetical protein
MFTYSQEIIAHFKDIELEISSIQHTFENTIKEKLNSFSPFALFFSSEEEKSFIITSRPITNELDYYTAISEMLFAYSSLDSTGVILAIDASKETDSGPQDLLEIYAACDHFCTIFSMPYHIDESSQFIWHENEFNSYSIEKLEKMYDTSGQLHATLEIYESLYLHTRLTVPVFEFSKLELFYKHNNFNYISLKESKTDTLSV